MRLILIYLQWSAFAQQDPNYEELKNAFYVYLYDGSLIQGNEVAYFDKFIGKDYISIDGQKIELEQVKFFKNEYGFYANVNPEVDHPRWSQASERRITTGGLFARNRIATLPFNGYGEEVAAMYKGMDLRKNY